MIDKLEAKDKLSITLIYDKDIEEDLSNLEYYIVGGAVRDSLLGREPKDLDFVVVGSTPKEMEKRGFLPIEADFPVFLDSEGDEWALARREKKTGEGYKGFDVYHSPDTTLEEDLERRDFTINAMAFDPRKHEIIDPYGGMRDLERGIVRHVSEAYAEDPLRVIRLARFVARYNFEPHRETLELSRQIKHELSEIPKERIFIEMEKAMKQAERPSKFFRVLMDITAYEEFLPEVLPLREVPAGQYKYHGNWTAWEHILEVVDEMHRIRGNDPKALLLAFFHDIGKGQTDKDILPHHYEHVKLGTDILRDILSDLKFPREYRKIIVGGTENHMKIGKLFEMRDSTAIKLIEGLDKKHEDLIGYLLDLMLADTIGRAKPVIIDIESYEERIELIRDIIEDIRGDRVVQNYPHLKGEEIHDLLTHMRVKELRRVLE